MDKKMCPALSKVVVCNHRGMGGGNKVQEPEFYRVECVGSECMAWDKEKQECNIC